MNETKLNGLLGMARRAGKLSIGFDAATGAVAAGKSRTLLFATDASAKTVKECHFCATTYGARVYALPYDKAALSAVIGMQKPVGVLAVCDRGFAKAISACCPESKEE